VNNGTSHIHELVASVNKLSQDLGRGLQQPTDPADGASNIIDGIQQLTLSMQARDQHLVALRASVDGLLTKFDEGPGTISSKS
jgi:ABC-type transporter Mla subunit MlaD